MNIFETQNEIGDVEIDWWSVAVGILLVLTIILIVVITIYL